MDVKFVTNSIPLGKKVSFQDLINKVANANTGMTKEASSKKKTEKDEAETSGQPQAEAKNTNGKNMKPDKEASGFWCDKCKCKKTDGCTCEDKKEDKDDDKEEKEASTKVAGKNEDEKGKSSGQLKVEPLHQKGESVKPSAVNDKNKKTEVCKGKKSKKTEASAEQFVKVAKLNSKTRAYLKDYWSRMYPADYADAMLAEK